MKIYQTNLYRNAIQGTFVEYKQLEQHSEASMATDPQANNYNGHRRHQRYEAVVQSLDSSDPQVRIDSIQALGKIDNAKSAVLLLRLLADEYRYVRQFAAETLAQLGKHGALALLQALKDEKECVRESAVYGLGFVCSRTAIDALIPMLDDPDDKVRYYAADSLSRVGDDTSVEPLIRSLKRRDETSDVRNSIADALVQIGGHQTTQLLTELLQDEDAEVRRWAGVALGDLADIINTHT